MPYTRETNLPPVAFDVPNFTSNIIETGPAVPIPGGINPVNIVHTSQLAAGNVAVQLNWNQTGFLPQFNLLNPNMHYHARVFLEQMGPNEGPSVPAPPLIPIQQGAVNINYPALNITLPRMQAGVYKVVVTLNVYNSGHSFALFHSFNEVDLLEVVA
jgi:hypothetical protein